MKHEDFKRYCTENNYVPLTTEMYSQAIKAMDMLDKIRDEIADLPIRPEYQQTEHEKGYIDATNRALQILDKYAKGDKE